MLPTDIHAAELLWCVLAAEDSTAYLQEFDITSNDGFANVRKSHKRLDDICKAVEDYDGEPLEPALGTWAISQILFGKSIADYNKLNKRNLSPMSLADLRARLRTDCSG
jgi:hypothetical protein